MKKLIWLLLLSFALPAYGQATRPQSCTLAASGTCNMGNANGAYGASFEEIPNGSPSGVSVTIAGCMQGNTCDTAADTNTSTSATVRGVTFTKVYDYFKITVGTLTGGTNPTMTINAVVSTANSHSGGGGGAVTSVFGRTGVVAATSGDYTCAQVTNCPALSGTGLVRQTGVATELSGDAATSGSNAVLNKQLHLTETAITNASSPYTVIAADSVITCDATAGAVTINLPASSGGGRFIVFKKIDSTANACTPTRAGADLIDGATSFTLTVQYASAAVVDTSSGSWSRTHVNQLVGDVTGISTANTVKSINGTLLSGLATGILKNTTGTGVPSIAVGSDLPAAIPIASVGSAGLSGTSPVTIASTGAIGCATCVTSAASLTSTAIMTGAAGQASQTPSATATLSSGGAMSLPSTMSATQYTSTIATGTAPFVVSSTTNVANLNASTLVGKAPVGTDAGLATAATISTTASTPVCATANGGVSTTACNSPPIYAADSGVVNAYVMTPVPAIGAYATGQIFCTKLLNAATGASTVNISGLGTKALDKMTTAGVAALGASGDTNTTGVFCFDYDGTEFVLLNPAGTAYTAGALTSGGIITGNGANQISGASNIKITTGVISTYNNVATVGLGVPGIYASVSNTAQTAAVTTATLCTAALCGNAAAGLYHLHFDFWGSGTACSSVTAGSVTFLLTWTDENAVTHAAVALQMQAQTGAATTAMQASFPFQTALANESASGDYTFSTNGTIIQYATGYTACTTGTGTYNVRAVVYRVV